jgi:hypothetical protein
MPPSKISFSPDLPCFSTSLAKSITRLPRDIALMKALGRVLGLLQQAPWQYFQQTGSAEDSAFAPEKVEQLIQQRLVARANKDCRVRFAGSNPPHRLSFPI